MKLRLIPSIIVTTCIGVGGSAMAALPHRCFVPVQGGSEYIGDRRCLAFGPVQRLEGVWVKEFEGSNFIASAAKLSDVKPTLQHTWLTTDEQTSFPPGVRPMGGHAYRVIFLGRRVISGKVRLGDGFGHMGMSTSLVVADHFISLIDLGVAPKGIDWPPLTVHEVR